MHIRVVGFLPKAGEHTQFDQQLSVGIRCKKSKDETSRHTTNLSYEHGNTLWIAYDMRIYKITL